MMLNTRSMRAGLIAERSEELVAPCKVRDHMEEVVCVHEDAMWPERER